MSKPFAHNIAELQQEVPTSAWGIIAMESEDGPIYQAVPEPDETNHEFRLGLESFQKAEGRLPQDIICGILEEVDDLIDFGEEPIMLQSAMAVMGRVAIMRFDDFTAGEGITFVNSTEPPIDSLKEALSTREYGSGYEYTLEADWVHEEEKNEIIAGAADLIENLHVNMMLNNIDDPHWAIKLNPTVIESPVALEITDIGGIGGNRQPRTDREAAALDVEIRKILGVLNPEDPAEGAQKVNWLRISLPQKAEKIREYLKSDVAYIAVTNEKGDLLLGYAARGESPALYSSPTA